MDTLTMIELHAFIIMCEIFLGILIVWVTKKLHISIDDVKQVVEEIRDIGKTEKQ